MSLVAEKKSLTVFKLVMMSVVAIDSLKNLPLNAQYGSNLLIYYSLAVILFFFPSALVSAELASTFPHNGGVYIWVREAFGKRIGFLTVWLQWLIAITWYPTILSFIVVNLSEIINPKLASNKLFLWLTIISIFWYAIILMSRGMQTSTKISTVCAIAGVIAPMFFIIFLGLYWLYLGHPIKIRLIEDIGAGMLSKNNFRLFITLLYSLMGMEMIATHAGEVENPQKKYPLAIALAGCIILLTVIPASLALAIVIPSKEIHLAAGVLDAFLIFLHSFHLAWLKPWVILTIAIGSFGIFYNWLLSSSRGLLIAAEDNHLPKLLVVTNQQNMPYIQLILQGMIFTIISTFFIFLPSFNAAYWLLTATCAELALLYYLFIFSAAIYLRFKNPATIKSFKFSNNTFILMTCCISGLLTCTSSIFFGFIPPTDMSAKTTIFFETFLMVTLFSCCISAFIICKKQPQL